MKLIKFRQPLIDSDGIFHRFHYWGHADNNLECFTGPLSNSESRKNESYQFTGLQDKNGKDIYEGDIVIFNRGSDSRSSIVEFTEVDDEDGNFTLGISPWNLRDGDSEIIGNIFENHELIK